MGSTRIGVERAKDHDLIDLQFQSTVLWSVANKPARSKCVGKNYVK